MAVLGAELTELRCATVVTGVTRDYQVVLRVVQDVLNTTDDDILRILDFMDRRQEVRLHRLSVKVTRDEVTKQRQHDGLDSRFLRGHVGQLEPVTEEPLPTRLRHSEVVLVDAVGLAERHMLRNVPVRSNPESGRFATLPSGGLDSKRPDVALDFEDGLLFIFEHFYLVEQGLVLAVCRRLALLQLANRSVSANFLVDFLCFELFNRQLSSLDFRLVLTHLTGRDSELGGQLLGPHLRIL